MKNCPVCKNSILIQVMDKTLKPKESELECSIECRKCNSRLELLLPKFLAAKIAVPFGVLLGAILTQFVLYEVEAGIAYKLFLIAMIAFPVLFIYWVVGVLLTKVRTY